MAEAPADIEALIAQFARLPGLGPRSARRLVLHLLRRRSAQMLPLAEALGRVAAAARECRLCGNVATGDLCPICADPRRDGAEVCVVETVADLWAM